MNRQQIVEIIKQEKIVAIVRLKEQSRVLTLLESLIKGGITILEITSNTPGFSSEISKARKLYPNVLIGAGTVTNPQIAYGAVRAGAQFLVTPNVNKEVIEIAHRNNIPVLMGAATPTEICTAIENSADLIKLFPAGNLGIDYFRSIKAALDKVDFFAVGGIDLSNLKAWMDAGAAGVGVGSALTKSVGINNEDAETTVNKFVELIKSCNGPT
jgi:2-dehydro-3-deoxyphosphogluconate aldolase/(4S)-4-hydroxy-2-oxoglutarate aldolase